MNPSKSEKTPSVAIGFASLVLAAFAKADNVIVNGGFETGSFSGWTVTGTGYYSVTSTNPVAAAFSARQVRSGGGSSISQTFAPITDSATPPANTLTEVPGGGDPRRFFSIIEKESP